MSLTTDLELVMFELLDDRLGGPNSVANGRKRGVRAKAGGNDAVPADIQVLELVHLAVRVCNVRLRFESMASDVGSTLAVFVI